jgi:hypothetical protein
VRARSEEAPNRKKLLVAGGALAAVLLLGLVVFLALPSGQPQKTNRWRRLPAASTTSTLLPTTPGLAFSACVWMNGWQRGSYRARTFPGSPAEFAAIIIFLLIPAYRSTVAFRIAFLIPGFGHGDAFIGLCLTSR